jgi:hypothetical protein
MKGGWSASALPVCSRLFIRSFTSRPRNRSRIFASQLALAQFGVSGARLGKRCWMWRWWRWSLRLLRVRPLKPGCAISSAVAPTCPTKITDDLNFGRYWIAVPDRTRFDGRSSASGVVWGAGRYGFRLSLYSCKRVNAAGDTLIELAGSKKWRTQQTIDAYIEAEGVINNWRSSHSGPLLSMRMLLTRQAQSIDQYALIAQRIKRLLSIEFELDRFHTMKLSPMQDIGGCRPNVG